jgi:hypothetical protein
MLDTVSFRVHRSPIKFPVVIALWVKVNLEHQAFDVVINLVVRLRNWIIRPAERVNRPDEVACRLCVCDSPNATRRRVGGESWREKT